MGNNKYKILIVEDEANIRSFIKANLETSDYQVLCAETCALGIMMYASHRPDLIVLDLGLPDRDGLDLIQKVRESDTVPIIVLSARSNERDKVEALDLGANDYITKPFGTEELLARIRAVLRSHRHSKEEERSPGGKFRLQDLLIDYDTRQVFVGKEEIDLTQTEYNIMAFLSVHAGKVLEQYGGVYFDTDVEAVRDIAPLMDDEGFIGFENDQYVASGLTIASVPHHPVVQAMIEEYRKLHFTNADGTTNAVGCPHLNTDIMERYGLVRNGQEQTVAGIHVYPADFFNPLDSVTGKLTKTENTYSIHWYSMSWLPKRTRLKARIGRIARRMIKAIHN